MGNTTASASTPANEIIQQQIPQSDISFPSNASYFPSQISGTTGSFANAVDPSNEAKRARKKRTGKRLASKQSTNIPRAKWTNAVELDEEVDEAQFLKSIQSAYGPTARVEISSAKKCNYGGTSSRQQISYQVAFDDATEAATAWNQQSMYQQRVASNLGIKGSAMAFDKPSEPKSIDGITLQLDSDSASILCGACLVYNEEDKCIKVVHYSDRNYQGGVIQHSGDTKVHGKSVHTIKLSLSDLPNGVDGVKQLFFTLCACGPHNLSAFKEPVISLYENGVEDINLIQYPIEEAGQSQSVVMCRLYRSPGGGEWCIQALGSEEWHIAERVCMSYHNVTPVIEAHLKVMKEQKTKGDKGVEDEESQPEGDGDGNDE